MNLNNEKILKGLLTIFTPFFLLYLINISGIFNNNNIPENLILLIVYTIYTTSLIGCIYTARTIYLTSKIAENIDTFQASNPPQVIKNKSFQDWAINIGAILVIVPIIFFIIILILILIGDFFNLELYENIRKSTGGEGLNSVVFGAAGIVFTTFPIGFILFLIGYLVKNKSNKIN